MCCATCRRARYSLKVTATGMRPYTPPPLTLTVGQNAEVNVDFEIQGTAEKVDVEATATLLQTQDASTGQLVNQKFINDLPLTSRSVFNLAQLSPGVTQAAGGSFGLNAGATNFISNGGRNSTADIVLDGVSQTNNENNSGVTTALYTPSVDAVQEFNVQQNTYTAEVGFGGNTVINVVTKSGTNQFHGSLFEFLQNSALNANNFFNNQNGVKISPKKNNQFGGTIGGPIRKDKLFFFFDYQGTISRSTGTARAGVASAAERQGDFGELCGRNGGSFRFRGTLFRCQRAALGSHEQHLQQQRRRRRAQRVHSLQQPGDLYEPGQSEPGGHALCVAGAARQPDRSRGVEDDAVFPACPT